MRNWTGPQTDAQRVMARLRRHRYVCYGVAFGCSAATAAWLYFFR